MAMLNSMKWIDEMARFVPTTREIGYLRTDVRDAVAALHSWREDVLHPSPETVLEFRERFRIELESRTTTSVSTARLSGEFSDMVRSLAPLTKLERRREVMSQCSSGWTSYLDNGQQGTDSASAIGHLSRRLHCDGVRVYLETNSPSSVSKLKMLHVDYFVPEDTDWLNVKYTVEIRRGRKNVCKSNQTGSYPTSFDRLPEITFDEGVDMLREELGKSGLDPFSLDSHCRGAEYWKVELNGTKLPGEAELFPDW